MYALAQMYEQKTPEKIQIFQFWKRWKAFLAKAGCSSGSAHTEGEGGGRATNSLAVLNEPISKDWEVGILLLSF